MTLEPEYFINDEDELVTIFEDNDGYIKAQTKDGKPSIIVDVLENSRKITKEEYEKA
jgi:hypothetical protein